MELNQFRGENNVRRKLSWKEFMYDSDTFFFYIIISVGGKKVHSNFFQIKIKDKDSSNKNSALKVPMLPVNFR